MVCFHANEAPNPCSLIGQKGSVPIVQNEAALASEDADGDIAAHLELDGDNFSPIG